VVPTNSPGLGLLRETPLSEEEEFLRDSDLPSTLSRLSDLKNLREDALLSRPTQERDSASEETEREDAPDSDPSTDSTDVSDGRMSTKELELEEEESSERRPTPFTSREDTDVSSD
jgi:hypothetical protein